MPSRTYYLTAAIELAKGGADLRRFHMHLDTDPREHSPAQQVLFIARCVHLLGYKPSQVANLGTNPAVMVMVFDSEEECSKQYAELVAFTNSSPDLFKQDIEALNAAVAKRARKAKARAPS